MEQLILGIFAVCVILLLIIAISLDIRDKKMNREKRANRMSSNATERKQTGKKEYTRKDRRRAGFLFLFVGIGLCVLIFAVGTENSWSWLIGIPAALCLYMAYCLIFNKAGVPSLVNSISTKERETMERIEYKEKNGYKLTAEEIRIKEVVESKEAERKYVADENKRRKENPDSY